jgi:hypothetical protein
VRALLLLAALFLPLASAAFDLQRLEIEYRYFHASGRIPEMPAWTPKEGLAVYMDLHFLGPITWENYIHAMTDPGQYRLVGLKTELKVYVFRNLSVGIHHHSQHILEGRHPFLPKFPVQDAIQVNWVVYQSRSRPSLF